MAEERYQYGGQAVIEGVMMRGRRTVTVAMRRADSSIVIKKQRLTSLAQRWRIFKLPIFRGVLALIESLVLGINTLMLSADEFAGGQGQRIRPWELTVSILLAIVIFVGLFIVVPNGFAVMLQRTRLNIVAINFLEGIFRLAIFLAYILFTSMFRDIRRVFQYHGAEHKVIHAFEAGEQLTIENARKHTTLHPRCGTNFLMIVMVIMVLLFSIIGRQTLFIRVITRLLMLPLIAGISYEMIKAAGKKQAPKWLEVASLPGLWLQKLTTREPDDSQLEVAIAALEGVLDEEEVGGIRGVIQGA